MELASNQQRKTFLGMFESETGVMVAGDPCMDAGGGCCLLSVKRGAWSAIVESNGDGNNRLMVYHQDFDPEADQEWEHCDGNVWVETGRFGFFDAMAHSGGNPDDTCDVKIDDIEGTVCQMGAIAYTGWGDGVFSCVVIKQGHRVVAAMLH